MHLITSQSQHDQEINELCKNSSTISIAVAFLKSSGLQILQNNFIKAAKRGCDLKIICGLDFGHTSPEALKEIRKLSLKYSNVELFMASPPKVTEVFHPKFYLFQKEEECTLISGSANLTSGGLKTNYECSICIETPISNLIYTQAIEYFESLKSSPFTKKATLFRIKQYETFYDEQKKKRQGLKAKPDKLAEEFSFNYENLKLFYDQYLKNNNVNLKYKERINSYKKAKLLLNEIADDENLNKARFTELFENLVGSKDYNALWHSGSIFRKKSTVFKHYKQFRKLVRFVRENRSKSPSYVFSNGLKIIDHIEGSGVNTLTEIMMTYNYSDFANLNSNPITVLKKEGGVKLKASRNSFSGTDYEEYCELIKEIREHFGLKSMLEADSFFNDIYWNIKNKNSKG